MEYEVTIGLEVHVQLKTKSKMFCGCSASYGAPPNTNVCPVCLGYPGAMPAMNREAVRLTVITGLMLGSRINEYSKFDRKSYFYPDMPKNYQISQYDAPLCVGGAVEMDVDGTAGRVELTRIHLEEDVGKNIHYRDWSGVDFNRAGVPLMEIVSEPCIRSPEEAYSYLLALREMLLYGGVSDCNLEEGNIRCDVNCSVRTLGAGELGAKTEIKNLNTFKGVLNSLKYEAERQIDAMESGEGVVQETRRWDADTGFTTTMRTKEHAHDYRYFPEPDLLPIALDPADIDRWRADLPEPPRKRRGRMIAEYGLPEYDAGVLAADKAVADFFEAAARRADNPKLVSNWMMTEMLRLLGEKNRRIEDIPVTPEALADLVKLAERNTVNSTAAKRVFGIMFEHGGDPERIVSEQGLAQLSDADTLGRLVDRAMAENPKSVADYRNGKQSALKFLIGQAMKLSRGKADPAKTGEMLRTRLDGPVTAPRIPGSQA